MLPKEWQPGFHDEVRYISSQSPDDMSILVRHLVDRASMTGRHEVISVGALVHEVDMPRSWLAGAVESWRSAYKKSQ